MSENWWIDCSLFQVPNDEGHFVAVPSNPSGAWGGPHENGGEGGRQVEFQTVAAGPEDRNPHSDAAQHLRRPATLHEGKSQI